MKDLIGRLEKETGCVICLCDNEDKDGLKRSLEDSVLVVNATSVGMAPDEDGCILPGKDFLHEGLDIVYNPWETKLLRMAKEMGCKGFNGYAMLLYQGAEAFRIWTGREMPMEVVRERLGK